MSCENCGAVHSATDRIEDDKRTHERKKLWIVCLSVLLGLAMVCGTVLACYTVKKQQETIIEQQYALNMQYADLVSLLSGAEITTSEEVIDGSGGGVAAKIEGNGNSISGGGN